MHPCWLSVFKTQCERQQELEVMCVSCWALQARIYHRAKVQRLMAISHPVLAYRAVTLSCWLNLALLTTKLPLSLPSHNVHRAASLHLEEPGLNKAEECTGAGTERGRCEVGEGSRPTPLMVAPPPPPSMPRFHSVAHAHHEGTSRASTQATVYGDAGVGEALSSGGRALPRCPCLQSSR